MVLPDKRIGIVCEPVNEKGILKVQVAGKKIWINHKRVKLHVRAEELYPEDSGNFTVKLRKWQKEFVPADDSIFRKI